jgi:hypothetical protein
VTQVPPEEVLAGGHAPVLDHTVENSQKRTGIGPHPQLARSNLFRGLTSDVREFW